MTETQKKLWYAFGQLIGAVIALVFIIVVFPWFGLGAINRLFGAEIVHNPENYLYFWVILMVLRGGVGRFRWR